MKYLGLKLRCWNSAMNAWTVDTAIEPRKTMSGCVFATVWAAASSPRVPMVAE